MITVLGVWSRYLRRRGTVPAWSLRAAEGCVGREVARDHQPSAEATAYGVAASRHGCDPGRWPRPGAATSSLAGKPDPDRARDCRDERVCARSARHRPSSQDRARRGSTSSIAGRGLTHARFLNPITLALSVLASLLVDREARWSHTAFFALAKNEDNPHHRTMANRVFEQATVIREQHLDTFGHVNNARYLELFEQARWDFITDNGFGLEQVKASGTGR